MKDNIDINSLIKFANGKYSYNDYLNVKRWFESDDEPQEVKDELLSRWDKITEEYVGEDFSLSHIFDQIHYNILLEENRQGKRKTLWSYYRQIAAILLFPVLALGIGYYFLSKSEDINDLLTQETARSSVNIVAPKGGRLEFILPDGSTGWLNSGSSLKYSPLFHQNRKVELTGEAWFDVEHYDDSEFIVSIPEMDVKVLGTQFNVTAYPDDNFSQVTLEEGIVEINGIAGVFNETLKPNEKVSYNKKEHSLTLGEVTATRFSAWKDGYLVIDNEQLADVVTRLERWYNVDIEIQDEVLKHYRFKATFKDEPLDEVLKLMAKTTPIIYKIEKRTTDDNGLLKQKKVTMKLKK